jgi:DNA-binding NarL/FixJ family response regulator
MRNPINTRLPKPRTQLSSREVEVVSGLRDGLTAKQIGEKLSLSPYTVRRYIFNACDVCEVPNRVALVVHCLREGIIPSEVARG